MFLYFILRIIGIKTFQGYALFFEEYDSDLLKFINEKK